MTSTNVAAANVVSGRLALLPVPGLDNTHGVADCPTVRDKCRVHFSGPFLARIPTMFAAPVLQGIGHRLLRPDLPHHNPVGRARPARMPADKVAAARFLAGWSRADDARFGAMAPRIIAAPLVDQNTGWTRRLRASWTARPHKEGQAAVEETSGWSCGILRTGKGV